MEPDEYYSEDSHLEAYWEDRISGYDHEQEDYYDNDPQAGRADYDLWEEEQVYQDNEGYDDLSSDYEDSSDFS